MDKLLSDVSESDRANVQLELRFISFFAIDYGVYEVFGDTQEKKAILNAFYGFLWHESDKFFGYPSSVIFPKLENRLPEYYDAIKTPHHIRPDFMIGKAFYQFCGSKGSAITAFMGSMWFHGQQTFLPLKEYLKRFKIAI